MRTLDPIALLRDSVINKRNIELKNQFLFFGTTKVLLKMKTGIILIGFAINFSQLENQSFQENSTNSARSGYFSKARNTPEIQANMLKSAADSNFK